MSLSRARFLTLVFATTVICVATAFSAGCQTTKKVKLPKVVASDASTGEICAAINANSEKIKTITAMNGSVGVANQPGWANSRLFFERPNKLRVVGTAAVVGRVLDIGCDGEQFWFWSSFENEKELYFCKLDQYHGSRLAQAIPIDPTMFPQALGVVEIKEEDVEDRTTATDQILLTVVDKRADGVYRKRVYIEPQTAAIQRQDIQNPEGETVLSVVVREQQYVDDPGVVIPKKIELRSPKATETVIVNLGTPTLNDSSKLEATVFQRPSDVNAEAVDLGASSNAGTQASVVPPTNFQKVRTEPEKNQEEVAQNQPSQNNAQANAQVASTQSSLSVSATPNPPNNVAPKSAPNNTTSDGLVPFPSSVAVVPPTQAAREAAAKGISTLRPTPVSGAVDAYVATADVTPQIVPASESEFAQKILNRQELQNAQSALVGVASTDRNASAVYNAPTTVETWLSQTTQIPTTGFATNNQVSQNSTLQPSPLQTNAPGFGDYSPITQTASPQQSNVPPTPPVTGEEVESVPSQPSDPLNDFPELLSF